MVKLFIVCPTQSEDGLYQLVTEDGFFLASHICSNRSWAKGDLLVDRQERLMAWSEYLKDGYEIEYIEGDSYKNDKLFTKNQNNFMTKEKEIAYARDVMKMSEADIVAMLGE